jgi:hypothetical protein
LSDLNETNSGLMNYWSSGETVQSGGSCFESRAVQYPHDRDGKGHVKFAGYGGMTMSDGLYRIELAGRARLADGPYQGLPKETTKQTTAKYLKSGFVGLGTVLVAGLGAWILLSGEAVRSAETPAVNEVRTINLAAASPLPARPPVAATAAKSISFDPATTEAITPEQPAPVDGLKIASQSWRRGGFGSNALVTFTLRNSNDYAVKDIEISCAFTRRDGSHLTDRTRLIRETVNTRGRKTFSRVHVGFVNVNANDAKCALVTASRA